MNPRVILQFIVLTAAGVLAAQQPSVSESSRNVLAIANDAACSLPRDPHQKTRSRLQVAVVDACLRLDQPDLAAAFCNDVDGWQQGVARVGLAELMQRRGDVDGARRELDRAVAIVDAEMASPNAQTWRRDRVHVRAAAVHARLGDVEVAAKLAAGVLPAEAAAGLVARAEIVGEADYTAFVGEVDRLLGLADFDVARGALAGCVVLHDRFYVDDVRRAAMAHRVQFGWSKLPVTTRLDLVADLVDSAVRHGDRARALEYATNIETAIAAAQWLPQELVARFARLAVLLQRPGATARASAALAKARQRYTEAEESIVDIDRADALVAIALAAAVVESEAAARAEFSRALVASQVNPNARPRAEDLVGICISILDSGIAIDAAMLRDLGAARGALRAPW